MILFMDESVSWPVMTLPHPCSSLAWFLIRNKRRRTPPSSRRSPVWPACSHEIRPDVYPFHSVPGWRSESGVNTTQSSLPGTQHEFEDMPAWVESALEAVISKSGWFLHGDPVAKTRHSQCRGLGSIPGQGTRSHMMQPNVPTAKTLHSQIN